MHKYLPLAHYLKPLCSVYLVKSKSFCSRFWQSLVSCLYNFSLSKCCEMLAISFLFLNTNDVEQLFILYCPFTYLLLGNVSIVQFISSISLYDYIVIMYCDTC